MAKGTSLLNAVPVGWLLMQLEKEKNHLRKQISENQRKNCTASGEIKIIASFLQKDKMK